MDAQEGKRVQPAAFLPFLSLISVYRLYPPTNFTLYPNAVSFSATFSR
jgi:hypothetical protein